MSGVSAASDIWSVGCTVIELLTCIPPYYELQPMPALYRIVQVVLHPLKYAKCFHVSSFGAFQFYLASLLPVHWLVAAYCSFVQSTFGST